MTTRPDQRSASALRPIHVSRGFIDTAPGAVMIEFGRTRVLCTATWEDGVPPFLTGKGGGWITAEYAMLPGSTRPRKRRGGGGRESEIQRLVGRSLRAAVDLARLGPRTITIDCDVLQADGGTRAAAITGGYVALVDCLAAMKAADPTAPGMDAIVHSIAAVSVGVVDGEARLDLCYAEDSTAEVDLNVVMTGDGRYIEIQGTAEAAPFTAARLSQLLDLARLGAAELSEHQRRALVTVH